MGRGSKRGMENEQIKLKTLKTKKMKNENQNSVQLDEIIHNPGLQHIAVEIFKFLDPASLGICRSVSKDWRDFIDDDRTCWQKLIQSTKIWKMCRSFLGRDFQESEWKAFFSEFTKRMDLLTNRMNILELLGNVPTFHDMILNLLIDQIKKYPRPRKSSLHDQEIEETKREQFEIIDAFFKIPTIDVTGFIQEGVLRYNAFIAACRKKAPEIVEVFLKTALERGFRVNQTDQDGMTAAHYAFMATDWRLAPSESQQAF